MAKTSRKYKSFTFFLLCILFFTIQLPLLSEDYKLTLYKPLFYDITRTTEPVHKTPLCVTDDGSVFLLPGNKTLVKLDKEGNIVFSIINIDKITNDPNIHTLLSYKNNILAYSSSLYIFDQNDGRLINSYKVNRNTKYQISGDVIKTNGDLFFAFPGPVCYEINDRFDTITMKYSASISGRLFMLLDNNNTCIISNSISPSGLVLNEYGVEFDKYIISDKSREIFEKIVKSNYFFAGNYFDYNYHSNIFAFLYNNSLYIGEIDSSKSISISQKIGSEGDDPNKFFIPKKALVDNHGNVYTLSLGGYFTRSDTAKENNSVPTHIIQRFSKQSLSIEPLILLQKALPVTIDGLIIDSKIKKMLNLPFDYGYLIKKTDKQFPFLKIGQKRVTIEGIEYISDSDILLMVNDVEIRDRNDVSVENRKKGDLMKYTYWDAKLRETKNTSIILQ